MRLGPSMLALVIATVSVVAHAATYVEPSIESRAVVGLAFSTSSPGDGASGLAGAGVELESGWTWEHGLSLVATFGEMRHARGDALTARLGLLDARATDDAIGLRGRWLVGRADVAPFVQAAVAADRVRLSGEREGSALGASAAFGLGLRLRAAPWELALALDARRTWLEAPFADVDSLAVTRVVATLGARLDW